MDGMAAAAAPVRTEPVPWAKIHPVDLAPRDFRQDDAATIVGWVQSAGGALVRASVPFLRLSPAVFDEWHALPGVLPCVAEVAHELCAYGEVWEDRAEDEAELARVIVAPERRGQGLGREFVTRLAVEARRRGFRSIVTRVVRGERAAFAAYRSAGFLRMERAEEASLNLDQDRDFVWMRLT
jgi:ribosomal protein S18 acetylase RimI-like enzyme